MCRMHRRFENRDESEDVEDHDRSFNLRQCFAEESIEVDPQAELLLGSRLCLATAYAVNECTGGDIFNHGGGFIRSSLAAAFGDRSYADLAIRKPNGASSQVSWSSL